MKYKIVFLLFFVVLVSGCSLKGRTADNPNNDILMAQDCGIDGLMCCPNTNPSCQYGQECCVDPNDNAKNYCADKCEYGVQNTFCRKDEPKCDDGLACTDDKCVTCGGKDQPCCASSTCQSDLVCYQDKCVTCGESGSPCCPPQAGNGCANQDKRDDSRNECYEGICTFCGSNGGVACKSEPFCNRDHLLNNGFCLRCGGYNQPCCDKQSGALNECDPAEQLTCLLGFCSKAK